VVKPAEHKYKGGRIRTDKAQGSGQTPRGFCRVCGKAKRAHFGK